MLSFPSLTACRPLCCYAITLSQHAVGTCKASCAYYLLFFFLKHPVGTVPLLRNEYLKELSQLNNWGAPLDYVSWRKDSENSGCPQKLKNAGSAGIIPDVGWEQDMFKSYDWVTSCLLRYVHLLKATQMYSSLPMISHYHVRLIPWQLRQNIKICLWLVVSLCVDVCFWMTFSIGVLWLICYLLPSAVNRFGKFDRRSL